MSKAKNKTAAKVIAPVQPRKLSGIPEKKNYNNLLWLSGAVIITYLCFYNALQNGFVNWDDDKNFLEHPAIQYATNQDFWKSTQYIFTHNVIGNYNPLANWTLLVEKLWYGFDQPYYFHRNNILLHVVATLLVFLIGRRLGLKDGAAFFLALLFGIHPMRVESVVWVTERKDVLFGVFYLGAIYQYILWLKDKKTLRWFLIYFCFILSLFSKIQAVSLPLSLLAIDYFIKSDWKWSYLLNKVPLFVLSLIFGVLGIYFLRQYGSLESVEEGADLAFYQRLFIGSYGFVVYLIKSIIPYRMSPLYPYPADFPWYYYMSMLIAPITMYILYWAYKNQKKALFFGLAYFIVNIVFLLQILGAGQGFLADRFTYMAYFGLFFIFAYYGQAFLDLRPSFKKVGMALGALIIIGYASMTRAQNLIWKNSETMWTHVLKYYDRTTTPYGNRANYYRDNGKYREAMADYNKSLALKKDQPQAYNSRARLYFTVGKTKDTLLLALQDYNKALEYEPENGEFYTNRGATYARLGEIDKAIEDLTKGVQFKPDHDVAYLNRSIMYQQVNRLDLALKDIDMYLSLRPDNADMWYEKGRVHRILGQNPEALTAYDKAISIDGQKALFYYERSKTHFLLKDVAKAKSDYQRAIQLGIKIQQGDTYPSMIQ